MAQLLPLKVAFIHQPWSVIDPPVNGPDSVALLTDELGRELSERVAVTAYCRHGKRQPWVSDFGGVTYRRSSVSIDRWFKLGLQQMDRRGWRDPNLPFVASKWCYRQFIDGVVRQLKKDPVDVIHIQNFSQFAPILRDQLPHTKIVLQMHCEWLNQFRADAVEPRMKACDKVLGVSDFLARKMRDRFPDLAARCGHVYNGVDLPRFAREPNTPPPLSKHLLFVGRLSPEKGVHVLLDAFKEVVQEHADAHLTIIGPIRVVPREMILPFCDDPLLRAMDALYEPGVYEKLLREKVAALPAKNIHFLCDGLDHDALAVHYRQAEVFVCPSVWEEPFGMPLVEAMAGGACAVASDGGAYPEILLNGQAGVLVERGTCCALARKLTELLYEPHRIHEYAIAGQMRCLKTFGWSAVAESLLSHYAAI